MKKVFSNGWMGGWVDDRYFVIFIKLTLVNEGGRKLHFLEPRVELQLCKLIYRVIPIQIPVEDFKNKLQWDLLLQRLQPYHMLFVSFPLSDDRPTDWCDREPSGRPGGPADCALGDTACTKRLPLSGQIPDQIQTGGKQRLEGMVALSISEHTIVLITITIFPLPHPLVFVMQTVYACDLVSVSRF